MKRLRRVISRQSNIGPESSPVAGTSGEPEEAQRLEKEGGFLNIERWPFGRTAHRRRGLSTSSPPPAFSAAQLHHRPSQSFSISHNNHNSSEHWRSIRTASQHKRTSSSSSVLSSKIPQRLPFTLFASKTRHSPLSNRVSEFSNDSNGASALASVKKANGDGFLGYPPGGLEISHNGLALVCEQKSPDVCEYRLRQDSAGVHLGDVLAIGLVSWAAHIFFRGHIVLALLPMILFLVRSSLQVYQESLLVVRNVGIQMETVTLAGFRTVQSYDVAQIKDVIIHEALHLLEYRYYMAILPLDPQSNIVIMFPHLLPKLNQLLPVFHGSRKLLF
ncbi:hypothetical protein EV183_002951 [Coemansia sp. RSA 2336]|nr:hypothetical protein EV183_002951 [Coemansia sp. RSA 2336]